VRLRRTARLAAAAALLLAAGPAAAARLFVDNRHAAASDQNPGTSAQRPLRTISAATARAAPGDEVVIASGTYREQIVLPRGGASAERRLRLVAAPGADVWIKGSEVVTGWTPERPGVWKKTGWTVRSEQVLAGGEPLQQIGRTSPWHAQVNETGAFLKPVGLGPADLFPGSFHHDAATSTLRVRLPADADPNRQLVEAAVRQAVLAPGPGVHFVELAGLKFAHSNTGAIPAMMGIVTIEGDGWLVRRCTFTRGDFTGLAISGSGHRIVENVANGNGNGGIGVTGTDAAHGWAAYEGRPPQDLVLEGNETSHNNYRRFDPQWHAGGLKATVCNTVRVTRHTAIGNHGAGLWFDGGCRNVTVESSVLVGNLVGIAYEISDQGRITGNLVAGSAAHGIYVGASSEVVVSNNTLDDNEYGVVIHGMPRGDRRLRSNRVKDNVIGFSRATDLVLYAGAGAGDNVSDHNLFARGDRTVRVALAKDASYRATHTDLVALAREAGQERTSRAGDPRWADRAAGDYRLRDDSPARRAVRVPAAAATTVAAGEPGRRHMGAWDERVLASPRVRAARVARAAPPR
jgi:parallel beta-helix repeat protein